MVKPKKISEIKGLKITNSSNNNVGNTLKEFLHNNPDKLREFVNNNLDFDDMDGICPDCGRATCGGECVCRCCYSPVECVTCGAAPCGGYC